jgi:hypothetical protein
VFKILNKIINFFCYEKPYVTPDEYIEIMTAIEEKDGSDVRERCEELLHTSWCRDDAETYRNAIISLKLEKSDIDMAHSSVMLTQIYLRNSSVNRIKIDKED